MKPEWPMRRASAPAPATEPSRKRSWVEDFVAKRDAARGFLSRAGMVPELLTSETAQGSANVWSVCGWRGTFGDHELIGLAEHLGWEGGDAD
jgi:hypothetical protein